MEEKLTRKEKFQIAAVALLANALVFGLLFLLDWLGLDIKKWFGFVLLTGLVFGTLLYMCGRDLRKTRSLSVFTALLTIHVVALVVYLRSAKELPGVLFFFAPVEGAIVAFVMATVGGVRPRLLRHRKYRPGEDFWTKSG